MKKYQFEDFEHNYAWLIFRMDTLVAGEPADIYTVMDLPGGMLLAHDIAIKELSETQVQSLLETAFSQASEVPKHILLSQNDPSEPFFQKWAANWGVSVEIAPAACFEVLTAGPRTAYANFRRTGSCSGTSERNDFKDETEKLDYECAKQSIPDSYDLCSCGSGAKYKFCCKRIFIEVTEAMVAVEEGRYKEALEWMAKARKLVGETSEVLCREAIVYNFFDSEISEECLKKCLALNPKHPRVYYLRALDLVDQGDLEGAAQAYKTAISYYPKTDRYHLNEAHNNLGGIYYRMGDYKKAKAEWEIAFKFMPSDKVTRENLRMVACHTV